MKPANELPWKVLDSRFVVDDVYPSEEIAETLLSDNAAYIVHAANAYPKLVEALKIAIHAARCEVRQPVTSYESLLRELGEEA